MVNDVWIMQQPVLLKRLWPPLDDIICDRIECLLEEWGISPSPQFVGHLKRVAPQFYQPINNDPGWVSWKLHLNEETYHDKLWQLEWALERIRDVATDDILQRLLTVIFRQRPHELLDVCFEFMDPPPGIFVVPEPLRDIAALDGKGYGKAELLLVFLMTNARWNGPGHLYDVSLNDLEFWHVKAGKEKTMRMGTSKDAMYVGSPMHNVLSSIDPCFHTGVRLRDVVKFNEQIAAMFPGGVPDMRATLTYEAIDRSVGEAKGICKYNEAKHTLEFIPRDKLKCVGVTQGRYKLRA